MAIFNSYVKLPEGTLCYFGKSMLFAAGRLSEDAQKEKPLMNLSCGNIWVHIDHIVTCATSKVQSRSKRYL